MNRIGNDGIEITEDHLDFLIRFYLKHKFIPVSIDEVPSLVKKSNRKRYVVFTFDDGYYDNYLLALPIFEKYKIPFAVYIPTDYILRKQFAWWYFLEDVIRDNKKITYANTNGRHSILLENKEQKHEAFGLLREQIQYDPSVLKELLLDHSPDLTKYHNLFLSEEQLRSFAMHPLVTIGSHSISHPSLARSSDQVSYDEIVNSKNILEKMIGKEVRHLAYPFGTTGDVGEREIKYAEEAGYQTALTTAFGDVYSGKDVSLFSLPRIWTSCSHSENDMLRTVFGLNAFRTRKGK
jgi:peptidoglycan/xylan/chitin deacetylase (PgdA/CDA1 family)